MEAGERTLPGPHGPVELPGITVPPFRNTRSHLPACPRRDLPPVGHGGSARQEEACLHPRKGQQRQQQVRCHWVPREFSEAEQLLLLGLGQGSSVQPAALP